MKLKILIITINNNLKQIKKINTYLIKNEKYNNFIKTRKNFLKTCLQQLFNRKNDV